MFYLMMPSLYLQLYGVGHMVKDHSVTKKKCVATTTWTELSD